MEADNQIESLFSHPENTIMLKLHLIVITAVSDQMTKQMRERNAIDVLLLQFWKPGKMRQNFSSRKQC